MHQNICFVFPILKDKLGRGIVVDVTLHGIGLETELEMDVGEVYELDMEIPFTLKAKVVRRIVPGQMKRYGLQFVSHGLLDKFLFKKLLKGSRTTAKVE